MKKNIKIIVIVIFSSIFLSYLLGYLVQFPSAIPIAGNSDTWIQYWGGFLGALAGVLGSFFVLKTQFKKNEKENQINELKKILPLKNDAKFDLIRLDILVNDPKYNSNWENDYFKVITELCFKSAKSLLNLHTVCELNDIDSSASESATQVITLEHNFRNFPGMVMSGTILRDGQEESDHPNYMKTTGDIVPNILQELETIENLIINKIIS